MSNFSLINNLASSSAQSKLSGTTAKLNQTLQRLSSGLRINKSGDDAAGLAIANSYRSDISVLSQGVRNANDGLSTLQIIDGGLNTISGLLDRASTLSSQSASGTFSGDRGTLQAELDSVLTELSRQAENIGLSSTGGDGGRFNKALSVFIGGGVDASGSSNTVAIDLSAKTNQIDVNGLKLSNVNIAKQTTTITGGSVAAATGGKAAFQSLTAGAEAEDRAATEEDALKYTVTVGDKTYSYEVAAETAATKTAMVSGLNAALAGSGLQAHEITEAEDEDNAGKIIIKSTDIYDVKGFTVAAEGTDSLDIAGSSAATAAVASTAGGLTKAEKLTINVEGKQPLDVTLAKNSSAQEAVIAINAALKTAGIKGLSASAVKADGTASTVFGEAASIKFTAAADGDTPAPGFEVVSDAEADPTGQTGLKGNTGGEFGSRLALESIKSAIQTLGSVQGKIGAGQNNLSQAIDLASAQITNFTAAESAIRDADIATEASNLARLNTLQQAGVSALAQANQSSQALLSLLR